MDLIIAILPVVTKDLPISPRFTPYNFLSRCKFSTLTTRQPMVEFYLLTFPRFPLRKKKHKSYFGKNRTHDFRTSRCAGYLLDHSGDEGVFFFFFSFFFFHLTYSRWTSSLPSCLWSLKIFPSLPGSRLTIFYRDASSALLQLVNQWLNFTYSRSHAFRYERKNTNPTLARIELTTSVLADVQLTY